MNGSIHIHGKCKCKKESKGTVDATINVSDEIFTLTETDIRRNTYTARHPKEVQFLFIFQNGVLIPRAEYKILTNYLEIQLINISNYALAGDEITLILFS
jgi:hypothetical protein